MNKKKYMAAAAFCILAVAVVSAAFEKMAQPAQNVEQAASPLQSNEIPEHIPYRLVFHQAYVLSQKAEQAGREGNQAAADSFRTWVKQDAQLDDLQAAILNEIAAQCEQEVKQVDAKAKIILDARRAYYKNGKLMPGQELLPPSEELMILQKERDTIILRYRDRLRSSFGEEEFSNFQEFIRRKVLPRITPAGPGQPLAVRE